MRVFPYHLSENWIPYRQKIRFQYIKTSRLTSRLYLTTSKKFLSFRTLVNECSSVDHSRCCVSVVKARQNSLLCSSCRYWCHWRCSGLRVIRAGQSFRCPACSGEVVRELEHDSTLRIDGETVEEVRGFCYLGELFVGYRGKCRANSENESGVGMAQMAGNCKSSTKQGHT